MKQGYSHGHDYVEIGGVKWATMNVGAKDVTDSGLYFAWGETKGYSREEVGKNKRFTWGTYKFGGFTCFSKYDEKDNLTTLQPQDDPVHANWRGGWRLPTTEEFVTLREATISEWVNNYQGSGINGLLVKDKSNSNKRLFFPAVGYGINGSVNYVGSFGSYWGSSLSANPMSAWNLNFNSAYVGWEDYCFRFYGLCVRGVLD